MGGGENDRRRDEPEVSLGIGCGVIKVRAGGAGHVGVGPGDRGGPLQDERRWPGQSNAAAAEGGAEFRSDVEDRRGTRNVAGQIGDRYGIESRVTELE